VIGSHAAGVFNRTAKAFERALAAYLYPSFRGRVEGLTLGKLISLLEQLPNANESPVRELTRYAGRVNRPWRRVRHADEPSAAELLDGLEALILALPLLKRNRGRVS
jgi:hypothetical protein